MSGYVLVPAIWIPSTLICYWTLRYNWPGANKILLAAVAILSPPIIFVLQFGQH